MVRQVAVGDVMTRKFAAISPYANLLNCARQMVKQRVGSLVVTEGKHSIGIITRRDVLWVITKKPKTDLRKIRAIDICTKRVAVIKPSAGIAEAFEKMREYGFRRLPVLAKGELVGVLTLKDILAIDPSFYLRSRELFDLREAEQKLKKVHDDEQTETEGLCDECGQLSDLLKVNNRLLCLDCREELY